MDTTTSCLGFKGFRVPSGPFKEVKRMYGV